MTQATCSLIQWEAFFSPHFTWSLGQVLIEDSYAPHMERLFFPLFQHIFNPSGSTQDLLLCMEFLILISFSDMIV